MEEIKISRDKKNPTWAWVCDTNKKPSSGCKTIIIDIVKNGCICVSEADITDYMNGEYYNVYHWNYFTIIKAPAYRPFKDDKEFIEYCKTRMDMRVIRKSDGCIRTITSIGNDHFSKLCVCIDLNGWFGLQVLFEGFTWIDGSPIGVKESV